MMRWREKNREERCDTGKGGEKHKKEEVCKTRERGEWEKVQGREMHSSHKPNFSWIFVAEQ